MKFLTQQSSRLFLLLLGIAVTNSSLAVSLSTAAGALALVPPPNHSAVAKELWAVELNTATNPDVLCLDGSTPIFYVDEAVNGPSDNWVFYLQGGGSCSTAQDCAETYINTSERTEMSSLWAPRSISGSGILNPNPAHKFGTNTFADYNRVKIDKCSYDSWMGNKSHTGVTATVGAAVLDFDLHFHGREIVKAVLNQLATGISYQDENCSTGENCRNLPPLQDASIVLFTGSSGGGKGLTHAADDLASELRGIQAACSSLTCAEADIRAVVDAFFMPGVDNEYRYSALNPGGEMNFTSVATDSQATATFDLQFYSAPSGFRYVQQETWRDDRDSSCEMQHGPNHPLCEDHLHILRYHLETPVFIRQDLEDPHKVHLFQGKEWTPVWVASTDLPASPGDYTSRVISQANMYAGIQIGALPVRIFAPKCQQHVGLTDNNAFYGHRMQNLSSGLQMTFHDALVNWVINPGSTTVISVDDNINYTTVNC